MDLKQLDIYTLDMLLGGAKWHKKLSGKFQKTCTAN